MDFFTAWHTEVGTRKKTNQDSMIIMQAKTAIGNVLFASVCDGMGGLAKGEAASAAMVHAFEGWFENDLRMLLDESKGGPIREEKLWVQWNLLIEETSRTIESYGRRIHAALGTTAVGVLLIDRDYYTLNVGDSRAYLLGDSIYQLTKDQTYVQREIDAGRMTPGQAMVDFRRNVLLQCVGASSVVRPVFSHGRTAAGNVFMLCCDGFRHVISPEEIYRAFHPSRMTNEMIMQKSLEELARLNIDRHEDDNISAILIKLR